MARRLLLLMLLPVISYLFTGCNEKPMESYYFPLEELREGLVYEYKSAGDPRDPPFYWLFRTEEKDGATFLTGTYYDLYFNPFQFVREERVSNGMLLTEYYLYENDTTGRQVQIPAEIEGGNVFSFGPPNPGTVLFSKVRFPSVVNPTTVTSLIKNRQYLRDTTYVFRDSTYEAALFYVRELIDVEDEGHVEQEFDGTEIYAKGLGLVYFKKNITTGFVTEYRLEDRYPMEDFEGKR